MDPAKVSGALVLVGAGLFLFAAVLPPLYPVWSGDLATQLRTIRAHRQAWTLCHICMTAAVIITAAGLGLLAAELGQPVATAAGFAYAVAAAVWCVFEMYRLSVPPLVEPGISPDWFVALENLAGRLFRVYMLAAYLSLAAFGVAIAQGTTLPLWSAWLSIAFGTAGAVSLTTGWPRVMGASPFEPPVLVHFVPTVLGSLLLLRPGP